jgi:hypothetical protein
VCPDGRVDLTSEHTCSSTNKNLKFTYAGVTSSAQSRLQPALCPFTLSPRTCASSPFRRPDRGRFSLAELDRGRCQAPIIIQRWSVQLSGRADSLASAAFLSSNMMKLAGCGLTHTCGALSSRGLKTRRQLVTGANAAEVPVRMQRRNNFL